MGEETITHGSALKARVFPWGALAPSNIDRMQSCRIGGTRGSEKVYEVGLLNELQRDWQIPESTASVTMFENGNMGLYKIFANKDAETLDLQDFDGKYIEFAAFKKDVYGVNGSLIYTVYLPKMSVNSIAINIGDPDAKIERSFEFIGNGYKILRKANKALCYVTDTVETGDLDSGDTFNIDLSAVAPVENPDKTGRYILQAIRTRSGMSIQLEYGTGANQYQYNSATKVFTANNCAVGDILQVFYSAGEPTEATIFVDNPVSASNLAYTKASYCTPYLIDGANEYRVYRLDSLSINATFDIERMKEIGSDEDVIRRIREKTTSISLSGRVHSASFDEIMRGKAGDNWGIIDLTKYVDTIALVVKCYTNEDKDTFRIGYRVDDLKYSGKSKDIPANDFLSRDITLEGDTLRISSIEGDL